MNTIKHLLTMRRPRVIGLLTVLGLMIAGFQNCSPVSFNPSNASLSQSGGSTAGAGSCATTLLTTTAQLRIILMEDNSGSTATTDPNHTIRLQTIQNFLAKYGAKTNLTYGLGMFATTAAFYDMSKLSFLNPAANPFGTSSDLVNAVNAYAAIAPGGNTGYAGAFGAIQAAIVADEVPNDPWKYVVVFMSDGMPTDISNPIDANILSMVDNLRQAVQSHGSQVTVSSVYFGPESDTSAIDHLQIMAQEGQGQFVDTNLLSNSLAIEDVITIPGQVCN